MFILKKLKYIKHHNKHVIHVFFNNERAKEKETKMKI